MKKPNSKSKPPENRALNLLAASVEVEAAPAEGEAQKLRRFTMTAYTGGAMQIAGWRYPVVVDLQGVQIGKQRRPILLDHTRDVDFVMGQTDSIAVMNDQLVVAGQVMGESPKARQVIALNDRGFAWQASIGARAEQVEFVPEGKTSQANGREFPGPVNIARRATLGEISFVVLGADDNTSAQIAASSPREKDMDFATWLESAKVSTDDLRPEDIPGLEGRLQAALAAPNRDEALEQATIWLHAAVERKQVIQQLRDQVATESSRVAAIRRICAGQHPELEAQAIKDGWDESKVELEVLRKTRPQGPSIFARDSGSDAMNGEIIEAALCMKTKLPNLESHFSEQTLDRADKLKRNGFGIQDIMIRAAQANGLNEPVNRITKSNIKQILAYALPTIEAGFSTFSLPGILSNIANKFILESFNAVEQTWRNICAVGTVSDFKPIKRYRLTGDQVYEPVAPGGELKHGKLGEEEFGNQANTYGKIFSLTRTDIINDDLKALQDVPRKLGRGAALKINEVFWKEFLDNSSFFTTAKGNYAAGVASPDTRLGLDGLETAFNLFLEQKDPDGHPLGIQPTILLVPNSLFVLANQLMNSTEIREDGNASKSKYPTSNTFAGRFRVERTSYLTASGYAGASTKAWYLLAEPSDLPVIEVVFLDGQETPTVETADADFKELGIQMRGYHDFGVAKQEHRAGVKLKGEA